MDGMTLLNGMVLMICSIGMFSIMGGWAYGISKATRHIRHFIPFLIVLSVYIVFMYFIFTVLE